MKRPCRKCDKMFRKTGRYQKVCLSCTSESHKNRKLELTNEQRRINSLKRKIVLKKFELNKLRVVLKELKEKKKGNG